LNESLVKKLERYEKVTVLEYPDSARNIYEGYLEPGQFAWKCFSIFEASRLGKNILWLDAGIAALKDLAPIFEIIQKEDVFFVDNGAGLINKNWTHDYCLDYMKANDEEKNGLQITANIIGYKANGKFQNLFNEAFELSKIKDVINSNGKVHRWDQSIFSILSIRYNCHRYPFEIYGEYRGILKDNQVCFAHRGNLWDRSGLRLRNDAKSLGLLDKLFVLANDSKIGLVKSTKVTAKKLLKK
jgi:hypothetical protein